MATKKSYYSKIANLTIAVDHGKMLPMDGEMKRQGEKFAEFSTMGSGNIPGLPAGEHWGCCITDDPDKIAFLDARVVEVGDILNQEQFNALVTPTDQKLSEKDREIKRLSSLVEVLKSQGKTVPAGK